MICLGKDIRGAKFEPGRECREGGGWSGVIVTVTSKDSSSQSR